MMKKNLLKYGCLALIMPLLTTSCASDSDSPATTAEASVVIDLNNFTYAKAKLAIESGSAVILKDSASTIPVAAFKKMENVSINISGETVNSYEGNDSVSVSLSDEFISFLIGNAGSEQGYVSYASTEEMNAQAKVYSEISSATRSSAVSPVTLSPEGKSMKINIHEARKAYDVSTKSTLSAAEDDYETVSQQEQERMAGTLITRASGYTFPRNRTVNIYLLIGKNATRPISYELAWQVEKAQKSIDDVFSGDRGNAPKLVFTVQDCDFNNTNDSGADLANFRTFVYGNSTKYPTAGKDVFMLVRQWWWSSSVLGRAYTNVYDINRADNSYAFGISQTTCLNATVLAHELGHVFGVSGHSTTPWYRLNKDLMNATCYAWVGCYHRTDINQGSSFRNAIYNNLKQK